MEAETNTACVFARGRHHGWEDASAAAAWRVMLEGVGCGGGVSIRGVGFVEGGPFVLEHQLVRSRRFVRRRFCQ